MIISLYVRNDFLRRIRFLRRFLPRTLMTETRDFQSTLSLYRMVPISAIGNRENIILKLTFQDLPI
jgi:hypothetical protein